MVFCVLALRLSARRSEERPLPTNTGIVNTEEYQNEYSREDQLLDYQIERANLTRNYTLTRAPATPMPQYCILVHNRTEKLCSIPNLRNPCFMYAKRRMCLPHFMIIGVTKCGTTALHYYLKQHPQLRSSRHKELHFFERTRQDIDSGILRYMQKFSPITSNQRLNFEATPGYLWRSQPDDHLSTARAVYDYVPHVKMVVILRDPVERALSHYLYFSDIWIERLLSYYYGSLTNVTHAVDAQRWTSQNPVATLLSSIPKDIRTRWLQQDFHQLVGQSISLIQNCLGDGRGRPTPAPKSIKDCYRDSHWGNRQNTTLAIGVYADYFDDWLKVFPRDKFLVLSSNEMQADPIQVLRRVELFLGIDPFHKYKTNITTTEKEKEAPTVEVPKRIASLFNSAELANKPADEAKLSMFRSRNKDAIAKLRGKVAKKLTNVNYHKVDMLPETRELLQQFYAPHNRRLMRQLGIDFGWDYSWE